MNLYMLIIRNKIKLEQMIMSDVEYKKILAQSRKLDKYIMQYYRENMKK